MNTVRKDLKIAVCIILIVLIAVMSLIKLLNDNLAQDILFVYEQLTWTALPLFLGMLAANTHVFRRVRAKKGDLLDKVVVIVVTITLTYIGVTAVESLDNPILEFLPIYIIGPFLAGLYMGPLGGLVVPAVGAIFAIVFNSDDDVLLITLTMFVVGIAPTVTRKVFKPTNVWVEVIIYMAIFSVLLIPIILTSHTGIGQDFIEDPRGIPILIQFVVVCGLFYRAIVWLDGRHKAQDELKERNSSLKLAMKIQVDSLPSSLPDSEYIDVHGLMIPASVVGGDFYDIFSPKEGLIAVLVADVSNKGLPASLFMMRAKATLRTLSYSISSPGNILTVANRELVKDNSTEQFVTVWLGIIDTFTGMLWHSSAGHPAPILKRNGECTRLEVDRRLMLGSIDGIRYPTKGIRLQEGDVICAFTDGITEQAGPQKEGAEQEFFGAERLTDAVRRYHEEPVEMNKYIESVVSEFAGGTEQSDDLTLLSIFVSDPRLKNIEVEPDTSKLPEVNDFVSSQAASMGMSEERMMKTEIVCEEIFVNICRHSLPKTGVEVFVHDDGDRVRVTFSDDGIRFNPLNHHRSDEGYDIDSIPIGGLGIHMVRKLSSEVSYVHISDRNILTFWMMKE